MQSPPKKVSRPSPAQDTLSPTDSQQALQDSPNNHESTVLLLGPRKCEGCVKREMAIKLQAEEFKAFLYKAADTFQDQAEETKAQVEESDEDDVDTEVEEIVDTVEEVKEVAV